jgi:diguanylate cyclase (GGDEF)-like protein/PAS domain S-box-containing protein
MREEAVGVPGIVERLQWVAQLFANSHNGLLITDHLGTVIDVNPTFTTITGYSREEIVGNNPRLLHSGLHDETFYANMWRALREEGAWQGEVYNRHKDGELIVELIAIHAVRDGAGQITHYIGNFSNLTRFKRYQRQLEQMAHYDALTQLPNRVLLADRIRQAIAWVQRQGTLVAVCYLDLDGFKPINDRHGHPVGDQVLIEVAERLREAVREGDTVARIGGDEFVVLLTDMDNMEEVETILSRIHGSVADPLRSATGEQVTASIGVTVYPLDSEDPDLLLHHADQAMYRAKTSGRNRYYLFDPEHDQLTRDFREGIETLRQALSADEFELYFQPIIDLANGQPLGLEALIRWHHPERGLLLPEAFLPGDRPGIENSALAIELDLWAIEAALKQMSSWNHPDVPLLITVNISQRTLHWPPLTAHLKRLLEAYPIDTALHLDLEVYEATALADLTLTAEIIERCAPLGIAFALDDFGNGYSSVTYLKRLPADVLKIAPNFIANMLDDPADMAVVESIIALAKAFGRKVIAEGVESTAQMRALLARGCHWAQGYGIAAPLPAARVPDWLQTVSIPTEPMPGKSAPTKPH